MSRAYQAKREQLPPADVLRRLLHLNSDGTLVWRRRDVSDCKSESDCRRFNTQQAGRPALAYLHRGRYLVGVLLQQNVFAHKVVFKLVYGYEPIQVDHINGVKTDNRPENLRAADHTRNQRNCKRRADNKSGHPGVRWNSQLRKWVATIGVGGRKRWLGCFDHMDGAVAARQAAEREFGYPEEHGKR